MSSIRIALAQINPTVGSLAANAALILAQARQAHAQGADVLITPELALTGYPPEDLLLRPAFISSQSEALATLREQLADLKGLHVVVGHVEREDDRLFNAASVLLEGRCAGSYRKQQLPDYGVFDETRYFTPGQTPLVFECKGLRLGVLICEDMWQAESPAACLAQGAQALLVLNASPYCVGKQGQREQVVRTAAQGRPVVYLNLVGGQDELVFDGASMVFDAAGKVAARLPMFREALGIVEFSADASGGLRVQPDAHAQTAWVSSWPDEDEQVYAALVMAVRDYVTKAGFSSVLLGLSGGLDSALVLALAVDALGAQAVRTVMMPSPYTARISLDDAAEMASGLGVAYDEIAIAPLAQAFETALAPIFQGRAADTTEENIQARARGNLLMAISNKFGSLLLTTGNKSELATGYCTLYGDMAGGFAPIKDIPKTLAYRLCHWRNQRSPVIPERILTRAPSAELRPDQTDQDSLPPYEVLDAVLERHIEHNQSAAEIAAAGFEITMVEDVLRRVRFNEYKRRQGAIGPKITARAFGRDWRYPIVNGYREASR